MTEFQMMLDVLKKRGEPFKEHLTSYDNILIKALRIADKFMREPSEGMLEAAYQKQKRPYVQHNMIYKAMRDQMIKELDDETKP